MGCRQLNAPLLFAAILRRINPPFDFHPLTPPGTDSRLIKIRLIFRINHRHKAVVKVNPPGFGKTDLAHDAPHPLITALLNIFRGNKLRQRTAPQPLTFAPGTFFCSGKTGASPVLGGTTTCQPSPFLSNISARLWSSTNRCPNVRP